MALDNRTVLEEWLLEVKGETEEVLYERKTNAAGLVSVNIAQLSERLTLLASLGVKRGQVFLAIVNDDVGDQTPVDGDHALCSVLNWFRLLGLALPGQEVEGGASRLIRDSGFSEFAEAFLKSASTGVDGLRVEQRFAWHLSDSEHLVHNAGVAEALHGEFRIPLSEESDGTRRPLSLL